MSKMIGIQGGRGSYHEAAVKQLGRSGELVYFETFSELFKALAAEDINTALTAIANTRIQFITEPYDELTGTEHDFTIIGESYLRVEHCLLGLPGAKLDEIKEVHSQAPALGQCLYYLENKLPHATIVEEHDTAGSAELVSKLGNKHKAAIASRKAAELYGLAILDKNIQDDPDNITRFLELAARKHAPAIKGADKTSMMLKTPQVPGALVGALMPFEHAGINLSCLQSRLIPNTAFDMMFFVEFEAGLQEVKTKRVLDVLHSNGYETNILGSYKRTAVPISKTTKV